MYTHKMGDDPEFNVSNQEIMHILGRVGENTKEIKIYWILQIKLSVIPSHSH